MVSDSNRSPNAVGIYEAKSKLSELIDRVAAGEEVTITRHGVPVARLVPLAVETVDVAQVASALAALRAHGARVGFDLTEAEIRSAIDEGRR
jgi:prevent-host-death family protein